jgi:hypothetical protein
MSKTNRIDKLESRTLRSSDLRRVAGGEAMGVTSIGQQVTLPVYQALCQSVSGFVQMSPTGAACRSWETGEVKSTWTTY